MRAVTRTIYSILAYGGINAMWRLLHRSSRRALVLAYHRVLGGDDLCVDRTQGNISASEFRHQIEHLLRQRQPLTLDELIENKLYDKPVFAVTFDDGYADNYHIAYPILRDLGITATVFLTSDAVAGRGWLFWDYLVHALSTSIGKSFAVDDETYHIKDEDVAWRIHALLCGILKRHHHRQEILDTIAEQLAVHSSPPSGLYLTWEQAREMAAAGWSMGAHTATHPVLTAIPLEDAKGEIEQCGEEIAQEVGIQPRLFAYPNGKVGDYNDAIMEHLRQLGYIGAMTMNEGLTTKNTDPFQMPRIAPKGGEPEAVFRLRISGLYNKLR